MRTVLRSRAMWLFALMFFGYDFVIWGMSSWVPSYLHDERGIALSSASLLLIPATVVAAVTTVIGGRISDRLAGHRSEEHTSELQSLMRISYAVFCLKKKTQITRTSHPHIS